MDLRSLMLATIALGAAYAPARDQGQSQRPRCDTPEYRQFDFWIGQWTVHDTTGTVVGHNTIRRVLGDCVLHESWTGRSGSVGQSFNIYDRQTKSWHQTWVDNNGLLLRLDGGLRDGKMVLEGTTRARDGGELLNRITWTPVATDSVRQVWEASRDRGRTWRLVFDGLYVRSAGGAEPTIDSQPHDVLHP